MDDNVKRDLEKVYDIIDQFSDVLNNIQNELNTLYVSNDFDNLNMAKAMIGQILNEDHMVKLTINKEETRHRLKQCYSTLQTWRSELNIQPETDTDKWVSIMQSIFFCILDSTYGPEKSAQEAIQNVMEMAEYGVTMIDSVDSLNSDASPEKTADFQEKLDEMKKTLESFQMMKED